MSSQTSPVKYSGGFLTVGFFGSICMGAPGEVCAHGQASSVIVVSAVVVSSANRVLVRVITDRDESATIDLLRV